MAACASHVLFASSHGLAPDRAVIVTFCEAALYRANEDQLQGAESQLLFERQIFALAARNPHQRIQPLVGIAMENRIRGLAATLTRTTDQRPHGIMHAVVERQVLGSPDAGAVTGRAESGHKLRLQRHNAVVVLCQRQQVDRLIFIQPRIAFSLAAPLLAFTNLRFKQQMAERLSRVGLEGREGTVLAKFSRGMLQRLGIAQALIADPRVAVLDEPASGLDPVGQRDIRNLMLDLRAEGTTVLLSSHQLSEVEAVCDEVTILSHGRVAAKGHIDDLLNTAGQVSVRAQGVGETLPASIAPLVSDVAARGGTWIFSVRDDRARQVVDALEDAGWRLISLAPKRDSLEDYFSRLVEAESLAGNAS